MRPRRRPRGPIGFTKYGTIAGGLCDEAHKDRAAREQGARWYLELLERGGGLTSDNGWYRVVKLPRCGWRFIAKAARGLGDGAYRAEWQNGAFRIKCEVVEQLYEDERAFRWATMELWLDQICALEFGLSSPAGKLFPIVGRYRGPHEDAIYRAKKADGAL